MEHITTVRTSQETHYLSAIETSRLMLFRGKIAVYCEIQMEHITTVRTSQETHYLSAIETNRIMLLMVMLEISYCTSDFEIRGPGPPGWWSLR
jgi:3-dehydroquinate dehydratase